MSLGVELIKSVGRMAGLAGLSKLGRFRSWPSRQVLIDEPLALAEQETSKLRRIYGKATANIWDGPAVFREAMNKHGGIQLDMDKRRALAHPISMLMWGELGAWIVSAELAQRLDDPDARMAASSQVFDEARHFYVLRDYMAALHVPVPPLDPYFAAGVRTLLADKDLVVKLLAMQILAEGTAQAIFSFLADAQVEPVLTEILPYIERDEARHVGLGILHLPDRVAALTPAQRARVASKIHGIGDLFAATQIRYVAHYRALGLDPQELFRRADRMLGNLSDKLGTVPGTDQPYFRTMDVDHPSYQANLDALFPADGVVRTPLAKIVYRVVNTGARFMPA
jgi:hypothetical protein